MQRQTEEDNDRRFLTAFSKGMTNISTRIYTVVRDRKIWKSMITHANHQSTQWRWACFWDSVFCCRKKSFQVVAFVIFFNARNFKFSCYLTSFCWSQLTSTFFLHSIKCLNCVFCISSFVLKVTSLAERSPQNLLRTFVFTVTCFIWYFRPGISDFSRRALLYALLSWNTPRCKLFQT